MSQISNLCEKKWEDLGNVLILYLKNFIKLKTRTIYKEYETQFPSSQCYLL